MNVMDNRIKTISVSTDCLICVVEYFCVRFSCGVDATNRVLHELEFQRLSL